MQNPIPSPRRSDRVRPVPMLPRRTPLIGPACPACEHPSCRKRRAQRLPRLGGHRAEYAHEHANAAALQARNPHLVIWYGEGTMSYWMADPTGLLELSSWDDLLTHVWARSRLLTSVR